MPDQKLPNLTIENAWIMFRNFAGIERPFNSAGDRNFVIFLDPEQADHLKKAGWNVKFLTPKEEGDTPQHYLPVAVQYNKGRPPRIVLISGGGTVRTDLGADEISLLDYADLANVDVVLNPFPWDVNGKKGIKAYLKTGFFTLNEDELELKYGQSPSVTEPDGQMAMVTGVNAPAVDDPEED